MRSTVPLLARAAAGSLPLLPRLVPGLGSGRSSELPEITLISETAIDRAHLAAYDRVCGFAFSDRVPATYPHVLAFSMHLRVITDPAFPLPAIGLVHVANTIVQHRPLDAGESPVITVRAADLREHRRGRQFDLVTEVRSDEELVWEERSTNLRVEHPAETVRQDNGSQQLEPTPAETERRLAARWRLPPDLGRRYAAVSGDYNPIHLHPLGARLFGFSGAIAHGMWTLARGLAARESTLPRAFELTAAFKRPIVLPASVDYLEAGTTFAVRATRDQTPHLEGTLRAA